MKKIVFLDIDGVLQTHGFADSNKYKLAGHTPIVGNDNYYLNDESVCLMNKLKFLTGSEIVLSSSWRRKEEDFNSICLSLPFLNIKRHTIIRFSECREGEIINFLKSNKTDKFIVVDDIDMRRTFKKNMIWCKDYKFDKNLFEYALNILNG